MKKDRKDALYTVRVTEDEMDTLDFMSDYIGKSRSDAMIRACKYFLNWECEGSDEDTGIHKKERKSKQIHLRMNREDADELNAKGRELGVTPSQIIRKAIKEYARVIRNSY